MTRHWLLATYIMVFVVFGMVIWFAWEETLGGTGEPRLVRAPEEPLKRAPDEPGGLTVENENASVVRVFGSAPQLARVEKVLPKPPPPPRAALEADPSLAEPPDIAPVMPKPLLAPELLIARKPDLAIGDTAALSEPDGESEKELASLIADTTASWEEGGEATSQDTGFTAPPPPKPRLPPAMAVLNTTGAPVPAAPTSSPTEATSPVPPSGHHPTLSADGRPLTRPPHVVDPAAMDGSIPAIGGLESPWRVQVAALQSRDAALAAWNRLRGRFPQILGPLPVALEEVAVGPELFYRVQASGFSDREAAARVCDELRRAGGDCFVVGARS